MKPNFITGFSAPGIFLCAMVLTGCWLFGGGGKVTLTVTNCPKESISITFSDSLTMKDSGTPYIVQAVVTIRCNGEPVNGAEIKVEWPWLSNDKPMKVNTDADGKYSIKKDNLGSDPTGQTIEVTIKGSDGEKTATLTIPPKQ